MELYDYLIHLIASFKASNPPQRLGCRDPSLWDGGGLLPGQVVGHMYQRLL